MKKTFLRIFSLIVSAAAAFNIALPGISSAGAESEGNEEVCVFREGSGHGP